MELDHSTVELLKEAIKKTEEYNKLRGDNLKKVLTDRIQGIVCYEADCAAMPIVNPRFSSYSQKVLTLSFDVYEGEISEEELRLRDARTIATFEEVDAFDEAMPFPNEWLRPPSYSVCFEIIHTKGVRNFCGVEIFCLVTGAPLLWDCPWLVLPKAKDANNAIIAEPSSDDDEETPKVRCITDREHLYETCEETFETYAPQIRRVIDFIYEKKQYLGFDS